ncbi:DEIH-box ATPase, partial [Ascosphaera atra]
MTDPNHVAQYKYSAMSNLVLQADRRFISRRTDEVTGDPESLAGRINIRDMGSRVGRDTAPKPKKPVAQDVERGAIGEGEDVLQREQRKRKRGDQGQLKGAGVLSAADALIEGLKYRPRTPATRATYDLILTMVANQLGDVPHEVVRSAADAVLEYLKDDNMKDFDKKKEIDDLLGSSMSPKEFNELMNLSKKITDYDAQDEDENMEEEGAEEAELDEKQGVAVVFDENEEEEDNLRQEVADESDEESDVEDLPETAEAAQAGGAAAEADEEGSPDEEMVLDAGAQRRPGEAASKDNRIVPVREIDAYWLQRQIGAVYGDPHEQQEKTREALRIMSERTSDGAEKPLRDVENDLMELFDYDYPDLVAKMVVNKDRIIWMT